MRRLDARTQALGLYATAAALTALATWVLLELWRADIHVPFDYSGEALYQALVTKSVVDHGWFWTNPNVGAPAGLDLYDFPVSAHDTFHLLIIKAMSLFTGHWALLFNAYFLLGFPLIALSALAVFRQAGVAHGPATVGAVLYAFLPTRLINGEERIFTDAFYEVPLVILVLLCVCSADVPLLYDRGEGRPPGLDLRRARSWVSLVVCVLSASTSLYYSFFAACLLPAGGIWTSIERRSVKNALAGVALAGVIALGLGANALPNVVYHVQHGPNHLESQRTSWTAEAHDLKIGQLLLQADVPASGWPGR